MTRRVLWITLFACLVVVGARMVEYSETAKVEIVRVAGIGLLAWSLVRMRALRELRKPLDVAMLAWVGVELLATVFSRAPLLSVFGEQEQHEGLLTSLALFGVYAGARLAAGEPAGAGPRAGGSAAAGLKADGPTTAHRTFDVWFAGAAVASVWAFLQAAGIVTMGADHAQLGGLLRPFGTLGHPNLLGVVTAAAAAAALARALTDDRRRGLHLAAVIVFAAATLITFSRGAWLALVAGLACAALLSGRARAAQPLPRWAWVAAAAAVAAFVAVAAFAGWGQVFVSRLQELLSPATGSGRSRLEIWRAAWAAWRARPWLGHGPDTMGLMSTQFQTPDYWRYAWGEVIVHAHSIYLHTLATRGAIGLMAGAGLAATLAVSLRRGLASGGGVAGIAVAQASAFAALAVAGAFGAWGISGALIATLLAAQAANLAHSPPGAEPPAAATTAAAKSARKNHASVPARPRFALTTAGVVGIVAALTTAAFAVNELRGSRGIASSLIELRAAMSETGERAQLDRAAVADLAAAASKQLPWDDHAPRIQASALMQWANGWPDPGPLLAEAERSARAAIARVPLRAANHQCLADALVQRMLGGEAVVPAAWDSSYATAARLWPASPYVLAGWARARLAAGLADSALTPARRLAALYPTSGIAQLVLAEASLATRDTSAARAALDRASTAEWHGDMASLARAERLSRVLTRR